MATKSKTLTMTEIAALMGCKPSTATSRLVALGYTVVCSRCGGSGQYSYNQIDGSRCFGCGGCGKNLAKITAEIVAAALERIAAGELAGYFAENTARREMKRANEAMWADYMAGQVGKDYNAWYGAASTTRALERAKAGLEPYAADHLETPVYRAQNLRNQILDRATAALYDKKATHLERINTIREAHAMILAVDAAWAARS